MQRLGHKSASMLTHQSVASNSLDDNLSRATPKNCYNRALSNRVSILVWHKVSFHHLCAILSDLDVKPKNAM